MSIVGNFAAALRPCSELVASLVVQFGGFVSGCVAFPFTTLFTWMRPIVTLLSTFGRTLGELGRAIGRMLGLVAPSASVVRSSMNLTMIENFWTQVRALFLCICR